MKNKEAYRAWKVSALNMILDAKAKENKGGSLNRGYCRYVKRFFFGDSDWHDLTCDTWKRRKEELELPMSWTQWYLG